MAESGKTLIQIWRTRNNKSVISSDTVVGNVVPAFGEPFASVSDDGTYLCVGDGTSKVRELPKMRIQDNGIFYSTETKYTRSKNVPKNSNTTSNTTLLYNETSNIYDTTKNQWLDEIINDLSTNATTVNVSKGTDADTKLFVIGTQISNTSAASETNKTLKYCAPSNAAGTINDDGIYFNAKTGVLFGSAWNDFAEYRDVDAESGRCVVEKGDGTLYVSDKRLLPGASIISDTYGMVIGGRDSHYSPVAVAGRVLAFIDNFAEATAGACVCSGKDGTVSVMTRQEIIEHPDCIIGTISEIPTYVEWHNIPIKGRIWIKIR